MKSAKLRLCIWALLCAPFSACAVDDRPLSYEFHALDRAGASPAGAESAGTSDAPPNGGDSGAAEGGDSGALHSGESAGNHGGAGSPSKEADGAPANGGSAGGAGTSGGAPNAGIGGSPAGGTASAGAAGHAGGAPEFPCGDLNQDAVDDCTQTLVQNSRFDSALSGWVEEPSTTQVWNSSDALGKPGSGSLLLTNTVGVEQAAGAVMVGSRQCVAVTPSAVYDFAARVMLGTGQTSGQAGVNVYLFDDEACQGNFVAAGTPIAGGVGGSWTALRGELWIPGGAHSMYVRLVAIKPFVQPSLSVLVDDVLVAKR